MNVNELIKHHLEIYNRKQQERSKEAIKQELPIELAFVEIENKLKYIKNYLRSKNEKN